MFYWLGFLFADGGIVKNRLIVGLGLGDKAHLLKLQKYVGRGSYGEYPKAKPKYAQFYIYDGMLVDRLAQYGIVPAKSLIAKPQNIPLEYRRSFLCGLFDGDGSISIWTRVKQAVMGWCGSYDTMLYVQQYLKEVTGLLYDIKKCNKGKSNCYEIKLGGNQRCYSILKELYEGHEAFALERKYNKFKEIEALVNAPKPPKKICKAEGCGKEDDGHFARGYCGKHAYHFIYKKEFRPLSPEVSLRGKKRYGKQNGADVGSSGICAQCSEKVYARGLCNKHYRQWYYNQTHERKTVKSDGSAIVHSLTCKVAGCGEPYCAKGYCYRHYHEAYRRRRWGGIWQHGEESSALMQERVLCQVT